MKKSLLLLTLLLSQLSYGATTGTLLLQGIVLPKLSIVVTPETVASSLDLETTQTNLKVAEVREKSNVVLGHKVTITSANLSNLKRVSGTEVFSYTLKYNSNNVNLSTVSGQTFSYPATLTPVNVVRELRVAYTGVANEDMVEGTYTDTVTLTIASN